MKHFCFALLKTLVIATIGAGLVGCMEITDQLTVNADGSGTYRFQEVLGNQLTEMLENAPDDGSVSFSGGAPDQKELDAIVAGIPGARVVSFNSGINDRKRRWTTFEISFDSIEKLLDSDISQQVAWSFRKDGDDLVVFLADGFGDGSSGEGDMDTDDPQALAMAKSMLAGLKIDRRLTLPSTITESNATKAKGNSAQWTFEVSLDTTNDELKAISDLKPEARCSGADVKFKLPLAPRPAPEPDGEEMSVMPGMDGNVSFTFTTEE